MALAKARVDIDLDEYAGSLPKYMADIGFDEIRAGIDPLGQAVFKLIGEANQNAPVRNLPPHIPSMLPLTNERDQVPARVFRYIRVHNIFTGDGGDRQGPKNAGIVKVRYDETGLQVDFARLDRLFDTFLAAGCVPFVELGFMPPALAMSSEDAYKFEMPDPSPASKDIQPGIDTEENPKVICNSPPRSYTVWGQLVTATARHLLDRYGPQVHHWPFELWNEPDLFNFFAGTPEDYCHLYDATARAVKSVDHDLLVGGPAVARENAYLDHFLRFVFFHKLPLDFISCHVKGGAPGTEPHPSWKRMIREIDGFVQVLSNFTQFIVPEGKIIQVLVDEADPFLACVNGIIDNPIYRFRETVYYPSFLCKLYREVVNYARGQPWLELFSLFSDNVHIIDDKIPFGGYRSLTTTVPVAPAVTGDHVIVPPIVASTSQVPETDSPRYFPRADLFKEAPLHPAWLGPFAVIKRPVFHVYSLFHMLGDQELVTKSAAIGKGQPLVVIASKVSGATEYTVLAANHREDFFGPGQTLDVEFDVRLPKANIPCLPVKMTCYDLSWESNNAFQIWKEKWGEPEALNAEQLAELLQFNQLKSLTTIVRETGGKLTWTTQITPNSIYLWRIFL